MDGQNPNRHAAFREGGLGSSGSPTASSSSSTLAGAISPVVAQKKIPQAAVTPPQRNPPVDDVNALLRANFFKSQTRLFNESDEDKDEQKPGPVGDWVRPTRTIPTQPSYQFRSRNNSVFGRNQVASYRSSRTWQSHENQRYQDFQVIRNAMRRLFKKSDVAKWTYDDYVQHVQAMLVSHGAYLAKVFGARELERAVKLRNGNYSVDLACVKALLDQHLPNHNLAMKGNRSRVLGKQTIWCVDWQNGKEEIAGWPTNAEMKWEGDDRAKTGVGRFPALPRERGPPSIAWNQLPMVEQYELDEVARIPTLEDILLPVDEIPEGVQGNYIDKEIIDAIDEFLQS